MRRRLPPIHLLDPLTLTGRELLDLLRDAGARASFAHTREEDEHQIAELAGRAELVPPLADPDDVPGDAVVVVTAEPAPDRREALEALLAGRPQQRVLDLAPRPVVPGATVAATAPPRRPEPPRLRVASPGAAGLHHLLEPLEPLGLEAATAVVERPASAAGMEGVERLAGQAAARLQGRPPDPLPDGAVLAFNLLAETDPDLADEVGQLLPRTPVAVTAARSGAFHGWAIHLGLAFAAATRPDAVAEAWRGSGRIEVVRGPLALDRATERDRVLATVPEVAGRHAVTVAVLDGLRVGGAATALEILPALL